MKKFMILALLCTLMGAWSTSAQAKDYGLWIYGTLVTDANKNDILGNRLVRYDSESNRLTIAGSMSGKDVFILSYISMEIYVTQDVTIKATNDVIALYYGNTTITGPGKLTLTTSSSTGQGIFSYSNTLTIKDANVSVFVPSKKCIVGSNNGKEKLIIDNSKLAVTGNVYNYLGGITLKDCVMDTSYGNRIAESAIEDKNGFKADDILILPHKLTNAQRADVNSDGSVDSADIVAVIREMK